MGLVHNGATDAAVHAVTFEIADGEVVGLVGQEDSGAATVVRMIAGSTPIDAGELLINGSRVNELTPLRRNVVFLGTASATMGDLTVAEALAFPLRVRHLPQAAIQERVQRVAALFGLVEWLHRRQSTVSGITRQRVAAAGTMMRDANVHLFVEPFRADPTEQLQLWTQLAHAGRALGATVLFATANADHARAVADRVMVLSSGRIERIETGR